MSFLQSLAGRSPWLYRINAGSCNGCDVELATTAFIPRYDVERLGCKYCGSPRHADIVLITGPLTLRVRDKVLRVWDEIPEPKVTVAVGICPISGGVFRGGHSIEGPLDRYLPVDINVPGCPPRPQAIMEAVLKAKELWIARAHGKTPNLARPPLPDYATIFAAPIDDGLYPGASVSLDAVPTNTSERDMAEVPTADSGAESGQGREAARTLAAPVLEAATAANTAEEGADVRLS